MPYDPDHTRTAEPGHRAAPAGGEPGAMSLGFAHACEQDHLNLSTIGGGRWPSSRQLHRLRSRGPEPPAGP
jgi:hypothetical protein